MLNSEQTLSTDSMQLAADAFRPPVAKAIPLWAIVSGVIVVVLATDFAHSSLQRAAPLAQEIAHVAGPGESSPRVATKPSDLAMDGIFEHPSAPIWSAVASPGKSIRGSSPLGRPSECRSLDQDIQSLKAAARVLLTAQQQDAIRASEARAGARQLALGC